MTSPTQKSLAHLRDQGYECAIVEKWNAHIKVRQDLFGFVDILAVGSLGTVAVQSTSKTNVSARIKKICGNHVPNSKKEEDALLRMRSKVLACLAAGWQIEVHGWDSKVSHAAPRIKTITVEDLVQIGATNIEIARTPF